MNSIGLGFGIFGILIYLGFLGLGIYIMVLTIMIARRGIKALDIYIEKNRNPRDDFNPHQ